MEKLDYREEMESELQEQNAVAEAEISKMADVRLTFFGVLFVVVRREECLELSGLSPSFPELKETKQKRAMSFNSIL